MVALGGLVMPPADAVVKLVSHVTQRQVFVVLGLMTGSAMRMTTDVTTEGDPATRSELTHLTATGKFSKLDIFEGS